MRFEASKFQSHNGYLSYEGRFVARFKYVPRNLSGFRKFLRENFTVEEYFARRDAGETPVGILESKGYVLGHLKYRN